MKIISGIYQIVNLKNNKTYIGSSKNILRRWYIHKSALTHNRHHCIYLQRSWNKHGVDSFKFEILFQIDHPTEQQLFEQEERFIKERLPAYNIGSVGGGDNLTNNPNRDDIIKRITQSVRERVQKMSDEERKRLFGKSGDKNPNWRGGQTFCECGNRIGSDAQCCAECFDNSGEKNPFYGKHHTVETIKRLREVSTGRRLTQETIEKCKKASIDFYNSSEGLNYRKQRSEQMRGENHFLYGVGHTEESKQKMSVTKKEKINNMSIEERFYWNKMRKIRMVRIKDNYYFSLEDAMKSYDKSSDSLRFRCESIDPKWSDYEFIDIQNIDQEREKFLIDVLMKTKQQPLPLSLDEDHTQLI